MQKLVRNVRAARARDVHAVRARDVHAVRTDDFGRWQATVLSSVGFSVLFLIVAIAVWLAS
jgi:hypothetical protein